MKKILKIAYDEVHDKRIRDAIVQLNDAVIICSKSDYDRYTELKNVNHIEGDYDTAIDLLIKGEIDGIVSGAAHPTSRTLLPVIKKVGMQKGISKLTSCFIMKTSLGKFVFADCAVQPNPNAKEVSEIAFLSGVFAQSIGLKPNIAMLSFSTNGSAKGELVDKVRQAKTMLQKKLSSRNLDWVVKGEVQLDAAINAEVAKKKGLSGRDAKKSNVLVFPDLNSGNIAYKMVSRFANAQAIGPIILGSKRVVNDLSRGCTVDEIIDVHKITRKQIKAMK